MEQSGCGAVVRTTLGEAPLVLASGAHHCWKASCAGCGDDKKPDKSLLSAAWWMEAIEQSGCDLVVVAACNAPLVLASGTPLFKIAYIIRQ